MKRFLATLLITLVSAVPAWATEMPVILKPTAMITGDVVKLGDLWDNLGPKAEVVLAGAPQPGKRIVADARWLSAVAEANAVDWKPVSAFDRIVIERAGQMVDIRLIEAELRDALAMDGLVGPFEVEISNRSSLNIMVPADQGNAVAVRDVSWDARTNRFAAQVEVAADQPNGVRQHITGRVFPLMRVPVLAHPMSRGDIIGDSDVKWQEVRVDLARRDVVTDLDHLIGQEPRVPLRADAPLRIADLRRPMLVERNSLVTVVLRTANMSLTTQGRVQEAGGKGDIVHITNPHSKRTVEAVVEGPNLVSVSASGPRLLSN